MTNKKRLISEMMTISPIIPVITINDIERSVDLAHALIAGGINILEVTLRTPAALDVIKHLRDKVPNAIIGAGTVINENNLKQVIDSGAQFAISPGHTSQLLAYAKLAEFPLLPGVASGSEIMTCLVMGYQDFKLFPAEVAGGIAALKSFASPFAAARFCPTGGVNQDNFLAYLALSNVTCIGGSWLTPKSLIDAGRFDEISHITKSAIKLCQAQNLC